MPAPVSVIIPTLDAATELPGAATALLAGLEAGLIRELVVADGGSADTTVAVAEGLGSRIVVTGPGRGGQLAAGVRAASGEWLLLLHADTRLGPGWEDAARNHMASGEDAAGYFRLAFRDAGIAPRIVAGWANLRSRFLGLPYGDQGLLLHRDLLAEAGGVPEEPLMEDVILARRLRGRLRQLPAVAATSAARYQRDGWVRRSARNMLTLARFFAGVPPDRLVRSYSERDPSRN